MATRAPIISVCLLTVNKGLNWEFGKSIILNGSIDPNDVGYTKQALPGGQVQTPLGPGDEAWRKEQERKGGVQWFLQKTWLS